MSRGNRKAVTFENDGDRHAFMRTVGEACERYDVHCLAYCLMGNHYHLALNTPRGNISSAMRHVNGVYTQFSNRRHRRTGHVFEGRFKSILVGNDVYLRDVTRYVVRNPVEAGLVSDPAEWKWSSYLATAGLEIAPPFLTLDWLDWVFGGSSISEAQARYRDFVTGVSAEKETQPGLLVVGDPFYQVAVRTHIGQAHHRKALPRIYRALGRPSLAELFDSTEGSKVERDRQILRAHVVHGYRQSEIASFLRLSPNTVSWVVCRPKRPHRS